MERILIVDDNIAITSILSEVCQSEGYEAVTCSDGQEALDVYFRDGADLILLDVMMPRVDGFEVCRQIRRVSEVPIIMITARGEDFERIMGLDIGADDYIVKPFSPGEVAARIRAILRRIGRDGQAKVFNKYGLYINIDEYKLSINGSECSLTKKELEILWTMATNPNRVFSRDNLLNIIWGYDYFGDNRTVDSHIKRLRHKMSSYPHSQWDIKTIWGVGYKFEVNENV
ncbi:response regulator transcription factor [Clostridium sp.]|uniref:response regulator transcription factor n=1 Tax=Clostridium sp. TaxID=1506 RepID=UPI002FC6D281